jgi:hypothetical protein
MRLCIERLVPPRKDRPINLNLPKFDGVTDIPGALGAILQAVAGGRITPNEGQSLVSILVAYRRHVDVELRLKEDLPDLSDLSKEELELAVSLGLKLKGGEESL